MATVRQKIEYHAGRLTGTGAEVCVMFIFTAVPLTGGCIYEVIVQGAMLMTAQQ